MKTLVIHPPDETTAFLDRVYKGKDWTIIDYTPTKENLITAIKSHDRIIMMGHGSPSGLFGRNGFMIDVTYVHLLREKNCVYMWCNADQFVKRYKLKGFYTGMIISEVREAKHLHIPHDKKYVDESNVLFTTALTESMDADNILESMEGIYSNKTNNPVIAYNEQRLYETNKDLYTIMVEKFLNGLRKENETFIYYNLFSILVQTNPDFLMNILDDFENYPNDWFRLFHKSLRQYDFFNEERVGLIERNITEDEMEIRINLMKKRRKYVKENSNNWTSDEYKTHPKYLEILHPLQKLNAKFHSYVKQGENISGHLDSILYQTISNGGNELYDYMNEFFINLTKEHAEQ